MAKGKHGGRLVFGNTIEYHRKKKGLSMAALALKMGFKSNSRSIIISRWERGEHLPTTINMEKLQIALGVTFEQLFPPPLRNAELKLKHKDEMIEVLKDAGIKKDKQIKELQERLYPTDYEVSDKTSNEFADEFEIDIE
jgi:transcriptional regulator with XRE-family HTH domain